ncbi:MAG: hypothetical protein E6767_10525 [Dysgonomonas sp.]|nr:hypothetical protein [Dysgonomonas sp.]
MKQLTTLLLSLLFLCISQQAAAQVTIGLDEEAVEGALLQLKTEAGNGNITAKKGMGLPRVTLLDATGANAGIILQKTLGLTTALNATDAKAHEGLVVYNMTTINTVTNTGSYLETKICRGVYVWLGDKWARAMTTSCN